MDSSRNKLARGCTRRNTARYNFHSGVLDMEYWIDIQLFGWSLYGYFEKYNFKGLRFRRYKEIENYILFQKILKGESKTIFSWNA